MEVTGDAARVRTVTERWRREDVRVGFVPTMGALHAGHMSLVLRSLAECGRTAVSIFVNPTQFGPSEDLERYPRTVERDAEMLEKAGVDLLFAPTRETIYPEGFGTYVEPHPDLAGCLCGARRPGHFRGVCTICAKLFNIVRPHVAYFGQKDFQQFRVVERMARDLDLPLKIALVPTVREDDGLAMSSRNAYLSPRERGQAVCLRRALDAAIEAVEGGERSVASLEAIMRDTISRYHPARLDYAEIRDARTLQPLKILDKPAVFAISVYLGDARLIDNALIVPGRGEVHGDDV